MANGIEYHGRPHGVSRGSRPYAVGSFVPKRGLAAPSRSVIFGEMRKDTLERGEDFSDVNFVVLVEVTAGDFARREAYVVASLTTEEAKAKIGELYADEPGAIFTAVRLPSGYSGILKLRSGEVLPWQ
jgi:hypothetical protein